MEGNKDSKFLISANLIKFDPQMNDHEDLFDFHNHLNNCTQCTIHDVTYKDLLQNGFVFKAIFLDRLPTSPVKPGQTWGCNFFISFLFTDGTKVEVPLQDFVIGNNRMWESKDNLIVQKNIPGRTFPDPANPLLPGVK